MRDQDIPIRKRLGLELICQGEHRSEVRRLLGVTKPTLSRWIKDPGPTVRKPTRKSARHLRAEELLRRGWRNSEVAAEVGATRGTVGRWRAAAGVPPLPPLP